jgi:hypothetical protein
MIGWERADSNCAKLGGYIALHKVFPGQLSQDCNMVSAYPDMWTR